MAYWYVQRIANMEGPYAYALHLNRRLPRPLPANPREHKHSSIDSMLFTSPIFVLFTYVNVAKHP